jgi:hypothetical protein
VAGLLAQYRDIAEGLGVQSETEVRSGEPAIVTLDEIAAGRYDLIVVGRRTPVHLISARLELERDGFVAELLETSPVPVLVVGEAVQMPWERREILVTSKRAPRIRRMTFWCADKGRMVTAEFTQEGPPLFRRETEILSCSAFDSPGRINCRRHCLARSYRRDLRAAR